eukprot:1610348-Alexandrium_andersonii.AAC.1
MQTLGNHGEDGLEVRMLIPHPAGSRGSQKQNSKLGVEITLGESEDELAGTSEGRLAIDKPGDGGLQVSHRGPSNRLRLAA